MAGRSAAERGIAYPKLTADQINDIIAALAERSTSPGADLIYGDVDELTAYLIGFYIRRWGVPPVIRQYVGRLPGEDELSSPAGDAD